MNVLIDNNGKLEYLESVNGAEYMVDPTATKDNVVAKDGVLINPDISSVQGTPIKYWKVLDGNVVQMTQAEKDAIDQAELQARKSQADTYSIGIKEALTAFIKVINLRLPAGQKITKAEMVTALKEEII